jgi:probable F420-dependent oxidoreductase
MRLFGGWTMRVGVSLPNNWGVEDPNMLIDLAVAAEELGFASVWVAEHLVNNAYVRSRIGERPYHHPLAILACVSGRTQRIQLGTSVLVLPFHHPFDMAKYVATLDQLSKGRVIMGVGVGNVPEEFEAMGLAWNRRGAVTDESIDVLRALWTRESADHSGKVWAFKDVHTSPKPYEDRRLPIWVGGMSDAALRRVARAGDGWQPIGISPEEFRANGQQLQDLALGFGRDPRAIDLCMRFNITADDAVLTEIEASSTIKHDDAGRMLEVADAYAAAGATHFIFALNSRDWRTLEGLLQLLAKTVLPLHA